jgi:hypothetical protein
LIPWNSSLLMRRRKPILLAPVFDVEVKGDSPSTWAFTKTLPSLSRIVAWNWYNQMELSIAIRFPSILSILAIS